MHRFEEFGVGGKERGRGREMEGEGERMEDIAGWTSEWKDPPEVLSMPGGRDGRGKLG